MNIYIIIKTLFFLFSQEEDFQSLILQMKDALFCEGITSASNEVAPEMWNVVILLLLHKKGNHYYIYPLK